MGIDEVSLLDEEVFCLLIDTVTYQTFKEHKFNLLHIQTSQKAQTQF